MAMAVVATADRTGYSAMVDAIVLILWVNIDIEIRLTSR